MWRSFERIIKPTPEVAVGKQVQSKQSHQTAEGQVVLRAKLKILEDQQSDQRCPNLGFEGIGAGADKGLDLQMLLEHLEEEFDLPAVSIDITDGSGSKAKVISKQLDLPLILVIPDHYPAQRPWVLQAGSGSGEADCLVDEDFGSLGQGTVLYDFVSGVAFQSGNEENAGTIPLGEKVEVIVAPIHGDDAATGKDEMTSDGNVGCLAIGDHGKVRQITVMVQEEMELDSAFGLTEVSPGEEAETEIDSGGIEAEQLVFEAEFPLLSGALAAK